MLLLFLSSQGMHYAIAVSFLTRHASYWIGGEGKGRAGTMEKSDREREFITFSSVD